MEAEYAQRMIRGWTTEQVAAPALGIVKIADESVG